MICGGCGGGHGGGGGGIFLCCLGQLSAVFCIHVVLLADEVTHKQIGNLCYAHTTLEDIHSFTTSLTARLMAQASGVVAEL